MRVAGWLRYSGLIAASALVVSMFLPAAISSALYTGDTLAWTGTTGLPSNVFAATSVVYNGYVYEMGGYLSGTVYYAPLNSNGTVGTWSTTTALPGNTEHATAVTYNGYIYEIAGDDSSGGGYSAVYYAKANSNGTLGSWTATASLPTTLGESASIVNNGYVYVFGGSHGSGAVTNVYYAAINPNGTLGSWTASTGLPSAVESDTASVYNGYVYVMGGFGSSFTNAVYYAPLNTNGTVGTWSSAPNLPVSNESATSVAANGFLYYLGGYNGSYSSSVYYAPLSGDGSIASWHTSSNVLPTGENEATSVANGSYLYELAGGAGTTTNAVYYTKFAGVTRTPVVTSPVANSTYDTVPISFTLPDAPSAGSLTLSFVGPTTATVSLTTSQGSGPYSFSLNPKNILASSNVTSTTSNTLADGSYTLSIGYQDAQGDPAATSLVSNVIINTSAANILLLSNTPAAGATSVSTTPTFSLTFNQAVTAGSGSIEIHKASDNSIVYSLLATSSQVTGNGTSSIIINPNVTLQPNTAYYATVDPTAFTNLTGAYFSGISSNAIVNFTTGTTSSTSSNGSSGTLANTGIPLFIPEALAIILFGLTLIVTYTRSAYLK